MKKTICSMMLAAILLAVWTLPAVAASVTLTDPEALLPVDIIINQEAREIRRVYDLSPSTDPSTLPMAAFERDGLSYECSDILREVIIGTETQIITQTETVESDSKDLDALLELLPQEKEVTTGDGFEGTVSLVLDSMVSEPSGYGTTTKPVTASRTYPNLSSADTAHLPKAINDGGRTLTLQDVQWQTDNTFNADDYEIVDRFTAVCTYGGTKTVSYVKGYTTTADYTGEVYRTGVTVIRYTVIFTGTPIVQEDPEPIATAEDEGTSSTSWPTVVIPSALCLGGGVGGTYLVMKKKGAVSA